MTSRTQFAMMPSGQPGLDVFIASIIASTQFPGTEDANSPEDEDVPRDKQPSVKREHGDVEEDDESVLKKMAKMVGLQGPKKVSREDEEFVENLVDELKADMSKAMNDVNAFGKSLDEETLKSTRRLSKLPGPGQRIDEVVKMKLCRNKRGDISAQKRKEKFNEARKHAGFPANV